MKEMILTGDVLEKIKEVEDKSVDCCVTSPPYYGLRDYGVDGQIGMEETPEQYISKLVTVFREVRRVLRDDGTLWVNIGDSYAGSGGAGNQFGQLESGLAKYKQPSRPHEMGLKPKDLIGIPWMLAFALRADGWYLRQDIIWSKPNPMPESVKDRCTKAHEYVFLLSKSKQYYYDSDAVKERGVMVSAGSAQRNTVETHGLGGGNTGINKAKARMRTELAENGFVMRNKRSVWTITTKPYKGAHFATFPPDLIEPCILAGSKEGGVVLDPFMGSGTTCMVAKKHGRGYIGIELNPAYVELAEKRIYEGTKDGDQMSMDTLAV